MNLVYTLFLLAVYLLPTIIASARHHQTASVAVVNVFLGWTVIGWVIALAMSVRDRPTPRPA